MREKRGQSATELLILTGFMFIIFLGVLSAGGSHLIDLQRENDRSLLTDTVKVLENEVKVAVAAEPGYYREFELPSRLGRADYEIKIASGVESGANFTEIVIQFVNYSVEFERTIFAPPALKGSINMSSEEPQVAIILKKDSNSTINFYSVPPPPPPPPPTPPEVTVPELSPADPATDDDITAEATVTDLNLDTMSVNFTWSVDGSVVYSELLTGLSSGTEAASLLDSSNFDWCQDVSVNVFANDGTFDSSTKSAIVSVQCPSRPGVKMLEFVNLPPTFFQPIPLEDQDVTVECEVSDADGDIMSVNFAWSIDGVKVYSELVTGVSTGSTVSATLGAANYTSCQEIKVDVFASDDVYDSTTLSTEALVQCPPEVSTPIFVTVSSDLLDLEVYTIPTDLNKHTTNVTFTWSVEGTEVYSQVRRTMPSGKPVSAYLAIGNFSVYDSVKVTVKAFDGKDYSTEKSAKAVVLPLGNSRDGGVVIDSPKNINHDPISSGRSYPDGIAFRVDAPADGATGVAVHLTDMSPENAILPGIDEVLIINLQSEASTWEDVGNYEFKDVAAVNRTHITFTSPLTRSYDGPKGSSQYVAVQRVPHYSYVTITPTGMLTASPWDGLVPTEKGTYNTGIVAFRTLWNLTVKGNLTVSTLGYRGGAGGSMNKSGHGGESYRGYVDSAGPGQKYGVLQASSGGETSGGGGGGASIEDGYSGPGAGGGGGGGNAGGGGGGSGGIGAYLATGGSGGSVGVSAGGGGVSYLGGSAGGDAGEDGGDGPCGEEGGAAGSGAIGGGGGSSGNATCHSDHGGGGGGGGGIIGDIMLNKLYFGGGGGGSGGADGYAGIEGGRGGGILYVVADTLTVSGYVRAQGQNGRWGSRLAGDGGAGAGGSIYFLVENANFGKELVNAKGGGATLIGGQKTSSGGAAGGGGDGRIAIQYSGTLAGTTIPAAGWTNHIT